MADRAYAPVDSAALATSVHLICRPRPENSPVGDWADVLRELPNRVGDWMERLQGEGIQRSGPGLCLYRTRARNLSAAIPHRGDRRGSRQVGLSEYLEKVWEVVGRTALQQVLGTAEAKARNGLAGASGGRRPPDRVVPLDSAKHSHLRRRTINRKRTKMFDCSK